MPDSLLDFSLSVGTADLRRRGFNQPSTAHNVSYLRPLEAPRQRGVIHWISAPAATSASFILVGTPMPRTEDGLRIGELMRMAEEKVRWACGHRGLQD